MKLSSVIVFANMFWLKLYDDYDIWLLWQTVKTVSWKIHKKINSFMEKDIKFYRMNFVLKTTPYW